MKDKIGVGVVGCGNVAWVSHLPWYWENPNVKIKGVCDVDESKAKRAAKRWGAEKLYTDFNEMLRRDDIHAVSIGTPPQFHCEQTIRASEAGKHVLCEKPMASTIEECDKMIQAAKDNSVKLMVGFMKRFNPGFKRVKEIIEEGLIGDVFHLDVHWEMAIDLASRGDPKRFWRMTDKDVRGGVFQDHGSHYIDLFRWWTGSEVETVSGEIMKISPQSANEDHTVGMLRMKNGAVGLIEVSWSACSISPLRHYEGPNLIEYGYVYGNDGGILFDALPWDTKEMPHLRAYFKKDKVCGFEGWHSVQLPRPIRQPGGVLSPGENSTYWFKREIDHFVDCIIQDKEPLVSGEDGRKAIEVINAVYLSSWTGEKIKLPLDKSPDLEKLFSEVFKPR